MSIVNVVVSPRRAVMLTDSSLYDEHGTIVEFDRKAEPIEAWTGAISFRGNVWGFTAGIMIAEQYESFDEFLASSAPEIEREYRDALGGGRLIGQTLIEIHVIGWSKREDRARAFRLSSGTTSHDGAPAFVWVDNEGDDGLLFVEGNARSDWRLHRQGAQPRVDFDADSFDPIRHGLPILEEQRRTPADPSFGLLPGMHVIGGAAWLTVVDRDGVRQGVIHEWPDEVGQPIRPAALDESTLPEIVPDVFEGWTFAQFTEALRTGLIHPETFEVQRGARKPAPIPAANMNRQQKRAAKAQARKGSRHAA